jgi:hypothetical protein
MVRKIEVASPNLKTSVLSHEIVTEVRGFHGFAALFKLGIWGQGDKSSAGERGAGEVAEIPGVY